MDVYVSLTKNSKVGKACLRVISTFNSACILLPNATYNYCTYFLVGIVRDQNIGPIP